MSIRPLPERPLEPADCWAEEAPKCEDWRDPSADALKRFAEEHYQEFIQYIIGYDQSLLFDFAVVDNRYKFKDFCGG